MIKKLTNSPRIRLQIVGLLTVIAAEQEASHRFCQGKMWQFFVKMKGIIRLLHTYKFQSLCIHSTGSKQSDVSFVVHKAWLNVRKRKRKLTPFKVLSKYLFGRIKKSRENFRITCHRTEVRTPYPHFVHVFFFLDRSPASCSK